MRKPLILFSFLFSTVFFLFSCGSETKVDKKKLARLNWKEYFLASIDVSKKHLGMGTDSMLVTFENRSDYKIDSAYLLFQNQGLLVHHMDTIRINAVPSRGKISVPPPLHTMGYVRSIKVISIFSKELEFRYSSAIKESSPQDDCFHCKN
jgi:hypothetical protein